MTQEVFDKAVELPVRESDGRTISEWTHKLQVAETIFRVENHGLAVLDWPPPFYTPFRTQMPSDINIKLFHKRKLPLPPSEAKLLFNGSPHWQLFDAQDHFLMTLFESKDLTHNRSALIAKDFTEVSLFMNHRSWRFDRIMRPFIEILFVNYLLSRGGLLLHGAAVRDGDQAYLFIGESGAGKTTLSQFWANKEGDFSVLGDERIIVRLTPEGWFAYGTPWPGLGFIVANEKVRISHIFFIRHGQQHAITPLPPPRLFQLLFAQTFSSFWDPAALGQIANTCERLIQEIPCFELASLKHESVTDFVRDFVRG